MGPEAWKDDEALLEDLGEALRGAAERIATVAEYGRGAYAWRTVDADLFRASLSFDSAAHGGDRRRAGSEESRLLIFTSAPLSVELEVLAGRIVGQIVPPSAGEVCAENTDGVTVTAQADEYGFFVLADLPPGSVRLRCDTPTGRLLTDWVRL